MTLKTMNPEAVEYIVVHCSATKPTMDIGVEEIDRWHRQRGFLKVGYHYVIRRDGTVEQGREELEYGAHVKGFNNVSVSICLVGGVDASLDAENNFTKKQFDSLQRLLNDMGIKYPDAEVLGHRDLPNVKKDCPSFDVKKWLANEAT